MNLTVALVSRDIRARYRRTLLGPAWVVLQPLLLMIVFTALSGVLDISSGETPYVIFSYSALVPWTFFSRVVTNTGPSVLGNSGIMKKIRVAREIFPTVAVVSAAVDAAIASIILFGMMIWFQVPVGLSLLWLPVLALMMAVLASGVGMAIASLGVFRRDFLVASGFLVQILLYTTPIIYPLEQVPERWQTLYQFNPLVGILEGFRSVLARGEAPDTQLLLMALPGTLIAFLVAWPIYRYMSRYFADVL